MTDILVSTALSGVFIAMSVVAAWVLLKVGCLLLDMYDHYIGI